MRNIHPWAGFKLAVFRNSEFSVVFNLEVDHISGGYAILEG